MSAYGASKVDWKNAVVALPCGLLVPFNVAPLRVTALAEPVATAGAHGPAVINALSNPEKLPAAFPLLYDLGVAMSQENRIDEARENLGQSLRADPTFLGNLVPAWQDEASIEPAEARDPIAAKGRRSESD